MGIILNETTRVEGPSFVERMANDRSILGKELRYDR